MRSTGAPSAKWIPVAKPHFDWDVDMEGSVAGRFVVSDDFSKLCTVDLALEGSAFGWIEVGGRIDVAVASGILTGKIDVTGAVRGNYRLKRNGLAKLDASGELFGKGGIEGAIDLTFVKVSLFAGIKAGWDCADPLRSGTLDCQADLSGFADISAHRRGFFSKYKKFWGTEFDLGSFLNDGYDGWDRTFDYRQFFEEAKAVGLGR